MSTNPELMAQKATLPADGHSALFTITAQGGAQVLRGAEYVHPNGHSTLVDALRIGHHARPSVRLVQTLDGISIAQEFDAALARALAAELLASADAIDAVMVKRGAA